MNDLLVEVDRVVTELHEEMYQSLEVNHGEDLVPLEYQGYFGGVRILYMGTTIWNSEEDMRNEEGNDYEPLRGYVVRQIIRITKALKLATTGMEEK